MEKHKMDDFLKNGKYLPLFMRDFSKQILLFELISKGVRKQQSEPLGYLYFEGFSSRLFHILVIDHFLHFMARHGYTLQKSRQKINFKDIYDSLDIYEKEYQEAKLERIRILIEGDKNGDTT